MSTPPPAKLSRRRWFAGAGAAGAAVATWATLGPTVQVPTQALPAQPAPEKGGGYSLSAHVQRYYETTRV